MDTTEKYLALVVTLLFVVGICLLIATVREQKDTQTVGLAWLTASAALLGSLLLPIFLGLRPPELFAVLRFLVAAGAVVVVFQAAAVGEYRWMFAFGAVACLFNPVVPIGFGFSATAAMVLNILTLLLFGLSLRLLKTPPRLTIASIIDGTPGSESL